jgi:hypothetical protein
MQEPLPLEYERPARRQRPSRGGCLLPLAGGLWVLAISVTVPISADRYQAPLWLKFVITSGHLAATAGMLYPFRGKAVGTWIAAALVSLWAAMQVMVLWYWN